MTAVVVSTAAQGSDEWLAAISQARVWDKVELAYGCWEWKGSRDRKGYGKASVPGVKGWRFAHRVVWERWRRQRIPDGMVLDHLCMNPGCVKPSHLEPVTQVENLRRWAATITACKYGHSYKDPANVMVGSNGRRSCAVCRREKWDGQRHKDITAAAHKLGLTRKQYRAIHGQSHRVALEVLAR